MATVTPTDLASHMMRDRLPFGRSARPAAELLLKSLGVTPQGVPRATDSVPAADDVRFPCLMMANPLAADVVSQWETALQCRLSVAEAVLFEAAISAGPELIMKALGPRMRYLKTLHTARERAAIAVYDYARDANWRRPVLFVRALRVARGYLRAVVGQEGLSAEKSRRAFSGRLGVSTVLISRFDDVTEREIVEAISALERSLAQGNDPTSALPYLLEAGVILFDQCPNPLGLLALMDSLSGYLTPAVASSAAVQLALCDVHVRIAALAEAKARREALSCAEACVDSAMRSHPDADDEIRCLMMGTVIEAVLEEPGLLDGGAAVGLRLPFGARSRKAPQLLRVLAPQLIDAILDRALGGDLLARGVCADLLVTGQEELAKFGLRRAVELRQGSQFGGGLSDERSMLLGIRDALLLAAVDNSPENRAKNVARLVRMAQENPTSASPILLLAQDVEANGPLQLPLTTLQQSSDMVASLNPGLS